MVFKLKQIAGLLISLVLATGVVLALGGCAAAAPSSSPPSASPSPLSSPVGQTPAPTDASRQEVSGTIASVQVDTIMIDSSSGQVRLEFVNSTIIVKKDGSSGIRSDLRAGARVKAYYTASRIATRIEIQS